MIFLAFAEFARQPNSTTTFAGALFMQLFNGAIIQTAATFAPKGTAECNGDLIEIQANSALFSLITDTFGGNTSTNFGLPDLRGRAPIGPYDPFLPIYGRGQKYGTEEVTLLPSQVGHTHGLRANVEEGTSASPKGRVFSTSEESTPPELVYTTQEDLVFFGENHVSPVGLGMPHNNMQPSLVIKFCISLEGQYPERP